MAEASRGRVTITLGSSGQVVKRNGRMSDSEFSDSRSFAGSKRSVRDRLGSDVDNSFSRGSHLNNKRRREDSYLTSFSANGADDVRIGKGDLRLKLMQRNASRQARSDDNKKVVDLREKLSRTGPSPLNSYDTQHRVPGSREASTLGRIPSTRSADNLPQLDSRGSYSPWTLDHLRRRSPDRVLGTSRGLPPPRSVRELQGRQLSRAYDEVRTAPYMGKDIRDASRPMSSTVSYAAAKPTLSAASAKPLPPGPPILSQIPPTSGIIHKSSYAGDEQQTVDGLLHSIGLGKYAILFKAEEVDMTALKQMKEHDLKELGIPMGPRKKILLALLPPSKRQS